MLISQFDNGTPDSSDEDGLSECTVEQCCYAGIQAVNQSNVDIYGGLDGGVPKSVFNKKSSCLFVIR